MSWIDADTAARIVGRHPDTLRTWARRHGIRTRTVKRGRTRAKEYDELDVLRCERDRRHAGRASACSL